ncbi:energy transducer TonB [Sphingomonas sp. ASY06-1R]|uniref:energy transducer TonB n=1 Tax=Sphingomonas sp. ASY06-1R TaxID=3445771 RepID=UPI003FA1E757
MARGDNVQTGICKAALAGCLILSSAVAMAQKPSRPAPANDPGTWIGPDDYPEDAKQARSQGAVGFVLNVNAEGLVTGCAVVSTSGSPSLDEQTCKLLRERAHFAAAPGTGVRAFASRIRWTLPVEAPVVMKPVEISSNSSGANGGADLIVGTDGIVTKCQPLGRTYWNVPGPPDLCGSFPAGSRYGAPTLHNGKPVKTRVRIQVNVATAVLPGS